MSDPETPPPNVSPQLANVQNSLYSVIQFSKKQQWTITNYVILVYAAIFGRCTAHLKFEGITSLGYGSFGRIVGVTQFSYSIKIHERP